MILSFELDLATRSR